MTGTAACCVALLDLDRFKALNDDHGHEAGDRALRENAEAWLAELRPQDTLARLGGDEFAVLLPDCDVANARRVVERLRAATRAGVSCSAGIAGVGRPRDPHRVAGSRRRDALPRKARRP